MKSKIFYLANKRKTHRVFTNKPINKEKIILALKAGAQAPSGANYQPWRYILVSDQKLKKRVREASEAEERDFYKKVKGDWAKWLKSKDLNWNKPFLEDAPFLLIVLAQNGIPYSTESVWLSIGYILLALEELGLHTVTYTPSDRERVLNVIDAPAGFRVEAILPIGISADVKEKESRNDFNELIRENHWLD